VATFNVPFAKCGMGHYLSLVNLDFSPRQTYTLEKAVYVWQNMAYSIKYGLNLILDVSSLYLLLSNEDLGRNS